MANQSEKAPDTPANLHQESRSVWLQNQTLAHLYAIITSQHLLQDLLTSGSIGINSKAQEPLNQ